MTNYEALAKAVISAMQGGPIVNLSPERSERIIAAALAEAVSAEREACAAIASEACCHRVAIAIRARGT